MIKVFEAFSGYGSQALALKRLGVDFQSVGISEIDKYAIKAYKALHGDVTNYGDISKIDWTQVPDFDLFTYSFPCTDISMVGEQKGLSIDSNTRSSLLWECERAIMEKKPKILLLENVKALISKKFLPDFNKWLEILENLGYTNYTQVVNAKHFGVPQNRERVFVVSVLDGSYEFPKPIELTKTLQDLLETNVDDKFYIKEQSWDYIYKRLNKYTNINPQISMCLTAKGCVNNTGTFIQETNRLRRLTPKESFRLMGVNDKDIDKLLSTDISKTQLYKMSGNSIVVDVLYHIFKNMNLPMK